MPVTSETYALTFKRMSDLLLSWLAEHPNQRPRFALPPQGVFIGAGLDQVVDVVARDPDARALVENFCAIGYEVGGPTGVPTLLMLTAVIRLLGLTHDTATIDEFEKICPLQLISRGSGADN